MLSGCGAWRRAWLIDSHKDRSCVASRRVQSSRVVSSRISSADDRSVLVRRLSIGLAVRSPAVVVVLARRTNS